MPQSPIFRKLAGSKFRSSFRLKEKDISYINEKGIKKINEHALDFLNKRIKTRPKNDGKQTPFKGHPVFIAQHATATCCRSCIERWHKIPKEKILNDKETDYLSNLIIEWINLQIKKTLSFTAP